MKHKLEIKKISLAIGVVIIGTLALGNGGQDNKKPQTNCLAPSGTTTCRAKIISAKPTGLGWTTTFLTQDGQTLTSYSKQIGKPNAEYQNWVFKKEGEQTVGEFELSSKQTKEHKEYCARGDGYRNYIKFWTDPRGKYTLQAPQSIQVGKDYGMATISPNGVITKWREMTPLEKTICGAESNYFN